MKENQSNDRYGSYNSNNSDIYNSNDLNKSVIDNDSKKKQ
jgi:hypothetical protein